MKKRIISSVVIIVLTLVVGVGSYASMSVGNVSSSEKDVQTASIEKKEQEVKKEEKTSEKKKAEKKETAAKEEKKEIKKETAEEEKKTVGAVQKEESNSPVKKEGNAGAGSGTNQSVHTHSYTTPIYSTQQTWVVDQAAWTETVSEPVYEMQPVWYCSTCGADITSNPGGHLDETMHGGYWNDWRQVQTGTNTYTVTHPEVGHYESQSIVTGYQCSCGAVQ